MKVTKLIALILIFCISNSISASAAYRPASKKEQAKNPYGYGFHQRRNRADGQWRTKSPTAAQQPIVRAILQRPKPSKEASENNTSHNAAAGTILSQLQAQSAVAKNESDLLDNKAFQEQLAQQNDQFAQFMAASNNNFAIAMGAATVAAAQVPAQQPALLRASNTFTANSGIEVDVEESKPNTPMVVHQDDEKTLHELQDMVATRDLGGLEYFQKDNAQRFQDLINVEDRAGGTLLHFAIAVGSLPIVKWLCGQGATVNVDSDKLRTPLLTSVAANDPNITQFLLEQQGIDVYSLEDNYSEVAQKTFAENSFYPWVKAHQSGEQIRLNNAAIIGLFQHSEREQMERINSQNAYEVTT